MIGLALTLLLVPDAHPKVRQLEQYVSELQPSVDPVFAHGFAKELFYFGALYGRDPFISAAIAFQESSLDNRAVSSTGDVGVFQFNPRTLLDRGINKRRFLTDLHYQIDQHFQLLNEKREICQGKDWWACYHSATPEYRQEYAKIILKLLRNKPTRVVAQKRIK